MITATRISWALGVAAVVSLMAWRLELPVPPQPEGYALVDVSRSDAKPCAELGAVVEKILAHAPNEHVSFFATGSAATAFEPIAITVHSAPAGERLMEGIDAAKRQNAAFVNDVVRACKGISPTEVSPIFLALKQVMAQAREGGGKPEVYVISDLEETAEPKIVRALKRTGRKLRLPEPIDNTGVQVDVCGFAQTVGRTDQGVMMAPRTAERAARLLMVWRALFTNQKAVEFAPFCS